MTQTTIHPTAIVDESAELGAACRVGPGAIVEADVQLGTGCIVGPHAFVGEGTVLGEGNVLHIGAIVGYIPQDLKYKLGTRSRLVAGDRNHFREYSVLHRSASEGEETTIGSDCLFMHQAHVGHDCHLGNGVILGPNCLLAGHVTIGDRAFLSGNTAVHQFCRVGRLGMLRGLSGVSMDIPPFCIADQHNTLMALNVVGLRRAGIAGDARRRLREVFQTLFRSGLALSEAVEQVAVEEEDGGAVSEVLELLGFIRESQRGIVSWRHGRFGDVSEDLS